MTSPPLIDDVIAQVWEERLTYLGTEALHDLADVVADADARGLSGTIIECGTALGGSAIVLAAARQSSRPLMLYDMFAMIPAPSEVDGERVQKRYRRIARGRSKGIRGDVYYGYRDDLLGEVIASFARFGMPVDNSGVELIKGDFDETLQVDGPVVLAHLDSDWYRSTMTCLERIVPHLVPGGRLVVDDYHKWAGCQRAVDEYFEGKEGFQFERSKRLHVVRE